MKDFSTLNIRINLSMDASKDSPKAFRTAIQQEIEMNCQDTAFFMMLNVVELANTLALQLPEEERESFYKLIKEKLPHGTYQ